MKAKYTLNTKKRILMREELVKQMDSMFEKASILFMEGEVGCGKTSLVINYINKHSEIPYIYLHFDENDNDPSVCVRSLREAGLFSEDMVKIEENFAEEATVQMIGGVLGNMCNVMGETDNFLLIFDQLQEITNVKVLKEMGLFFTYLPEKCRVMILSRKMLPIEWRNLYYGGQIGIFPAENMMFQRREIRDYFYLHKEVISVRQAEKIVQSTGGWPGVVAMYRLHQAGLERHKFDDRMVHIFLVDKLWKNLDFREKMLLWCGHKVPFFNKEVCEKVFLMSDIDWVLFDLHNKGLLVYDLEKNQYRLSQIMRYFFDNSTEWISQGVDFDEMMERAVSWYKMHGYLNEAFKCITDAKRIESMLIEHGPNLIKEIAFKDLKYYLSFCSNSCDDTSIIYLQGWTAAKEQKTDILDEKLQTLLDRCSIECGIENEAKMMEYYLNLLFQDYRVDICTWLYAIEKYWIYPKKMKMFTFSGGNPVICCGIKNFAPLFVGKLKEERNFIRIWKENLDYEACLALDIAKYGFYIETDRADKVYEVIQDLYQKVMTMENYELIAGVFYLLLELQKMRFSYDFHNELDRIRSKVDSCGEFAIIDNCRALGAFLSDYQGQKDEMSRWLLYDSPDEQQENNLQDNAYLLLLKMKAYLIMKQYTKAINLCERLAEYYEKKNLHQMLAECLFYHAAILYENGDKKEALMKATKALTVGAKYRYIKLYCELGETGVILIEEYHRLTGLKISDKKVYYYGNVLRANYEGFQSILLRQAKKSKRSYGSDSKKEALPYGQLTITELAILRYISNGMANQEIGELMNIKVSTVKTHVYNIYRKLGVSTRVQAVNAAKEQGLIG